MATFWPFMYAANRHLDYRSVVAPDFLVRGKQVGLLQRNLDAEIERGREGAIRTTQVDANGIGPVTLFYRPAFVREDGEEACDAYGRPIVRVDGIAFRGAKGAGDFEHGDLERFLSKAQTRLDDQFREFWETTSNRRAIPSSPLCFGEEEAEAGEGTAVQSGPRNRLTREWKYFIAGGSTVTLLLVVPLALSLVLQPARSDQLALLHRDLQEIKALVAEVEALAEFDELKKLVADISSRLKKTAAAGPEKKPASKQDSQQEKSSPE